MKTILVIYTYILSGHNFLLADFDGGESGVLSPCCIACAMRINSIAKSLYEQSCRCDIDDYVMN